MKGLAIGAAVAAGFVVALVGLGASHPTKVCFGPTAVEGLAGPRRGPVSVEHGPRSVRAVALTFDDGPSSATEAVLRILRDRHAKATFFVVGNRLATSTARRRLREMERDGDEIGNHTCTHPHLDQLDAAQARLEFTRTNELIRTATGRTPRLARAPFAATNPSVLVAADAAGLTLVGWDVDSLDWRGGGGDPPGPIVRRVLADARPGSIVAMHDQGRPVDRTVKALPAIIESLRRRGLRFVTVSRLLGSREERR